MGHLSIDQHGRATYSLLRNVDFDTVWKLSDILINEYGFVRVNVIDLIDVLDISHRRDNVVIELHHDAYTPCDIVAKNPESNYFIRELAGQLNLDEL